MTLLLFVIISTNSNKKESLLTPLFIPPLEVSERIRPFTSGTGLIGCFRILVEQPTKRGRPDVNAPKEGYGEIGKPVKWPKSDDGCRSDDHTCFTTFQLDKPVLVSEKTDRMVLHADSEERISSGGFSKIQDESFHRGVCYSG